MKPVVAHDIEHKVISIALPKLDWVVQGVIIKVLLWLPFLQCNSGQLSYFYHKEAKDIVLYFSLFTLQSLSIPKVPVHTSVSPSSCDLPYSDISHKYSKLWKRNSYLPKKSGSAEASIFFISSFVSALTSASF